MRILLVDGDADYRPTIRRALLEAPPRLGSLLWPRRGRGLTEILDRDPVDIVISDMALPDMEATGSLLSGPGAATGCRAHRPGDHAPGQWLGEAEGYTRIFIQAAGGRLPDRVVRRSLDIEDDRVECADVCALCGELGPDSGAP